MEHNTIQHGELCDELITLYLFVPKYGNSTLVAIMYIQNLWQLKIVNNTSKVCCLVEVLYYGVYFKLIY